MTAWLSAYFLTQLVEVPLWLKGGHSLSRPRAWIVACGASSITHPILWFAIPWDRWPYVPTLIGGEVFVIVMEALFAGRLGLPRPWLWSLIANGASVAAGFLSRWLFGWP